MGEMDRLMNAIMVSCIYINIKTNSNCTLYVHLIACYLYHIEALKI